MVFYLFAAGQSLSGSGIINLDKRMAGIKNIALKGEFDSGDLNKRINYLHVY